MSRDQGKFEQLAESGSSGGLVADTIGFLRDNKKWWLIPVLVTLALLAGLVFLGGTAAAPFIYTLF